MRVSTSVIAADPGTDDDATETLESYVRDGYVRRVPIDGAEAERTWRTDLARIAVAEHGADWVIPSTAREFWWPRGESLNDVLAVIPAAICGCPGAGPSVRRRSRGEWALLRPHGQSDVVARLRGGGLEHPFRACCVRCIAASRTSWSTADDWTLGGRRVPLRAWYPIEVFSFPPSSADVSTTRSSTAR